MSSPHQRDARAQKLLGAQVDKAQIQTGQSVQFSMEMEMNEDPKRGLLGCRV